MKKCLIIREIDTLSALIRQEGQLNCAAVQGLDLREVEIDWDKLECAGAVFMGCHFPDNLNEQNLRKRGAMILPRFEDLPYDSYRSQLYTREELMNGWTPSVDESVDKKIYDHFHAKGGNCLLYTSPSPRDRQKSRMPSSA